MLILLGSDAEESFLDFDSDALGFLDLSGFLFVSWVEASHLSYLQIRILKKWGHSIS